MLIVAVSIYFLVGVTVALYVTVKRDRPREKEMRDWMHLMGSSPYTLLLPIFLWPLWLLFMFFPQDSFLERSNPEPDSTPDYIGKLGQVVIPLTPVGRVSI